MPMRKKRTAKKSKLNLQPFTLMIQLMLRTPQDEAKMIDEHLTYVTSILSKRMEKRSVVDNEVMRIQESKKRKEFDKSKMEIQVRKTFGSKRYAREQLLDIDRSLKRVEEEEAYALEDLEKADNTIKRYENLAKKIELTSAYRKRLAKIVDLQDEYDERLAAIAKPKRYFEKNAELTEQEQRKILFKILTEQEETLTRDVIFRDILDYGAFQRLPKNRYPCIQNTKHYGLQAILQNRLHLGHHLNSTKHVDRRHVPRSLHFTCRLRDKRSLKNHHRTPNRITRTMDNKHPCSRRQRQTRRHGSLRRNATTLQSNQTISKDTYPAATYLNTA